MVYLLPFFTVMIWGGNSIVNKMAASAIEPSAMSFYRWFVAMVLLTPFCLPAVIKQRHVIRPYLAKLAFLALLGMVLNQSLGYYAGLTTTASNMALITSSRSFDQCFLECTFTWQVDFHAERGRWCDFIRRLGVYVRARRYHLLPASRYDAR